MALYLLPALLRVTYEGEAFFFCPCLKDLLTRVADPDLQIKRVGRGGGGRRSPKNFFSALWASVWSKIGGGAAPRAPPLAPPLDVTF